CRTTTVRIICGVREEAVLWVSSAITSRKYKVHGWETAHSPTDGGWTRSGSTSSHRHRHRHRYEERASPRAVAPRTGRGGASWLSYHARTDRTEVIKDGVLKTNRAGADKRNRRATPRQRTPVHELPGVRRSVSLDGF
uniref:Uncharacterized protein n=1 Tax=Anopheles dirus TaxID=7168 RepID=A0A182NGN8_9DIPT